MRQYSGHFYGNETCPLSMSAVILIAVDTLSNTAKSEKRNKLIDNPDQDVTSTVSLSLSHWYPGSGMVLDCIDS